MPASSDAYDAIIIGAGQGGGPLAGALARAGWSTALVERRNVGGTCVNRGCTPTKTMIASARVAHVVGRSGDYGVLANDVSVDLETVRERKRDIVTSFRTGSRNAVESTDGLDLLMGTASFDDPKTVTVTMNDGSATRRLTSDTIIINTGTHPFIPPVEGLDDAPYLTSESIMELADVPDHLIVLGGGYIGLEFGQMFRRFGADVTIIERADRIIAREDADVTNALTEILEDEGLRVLEGTTAEGVDTHDDGTISLALNGERAPTRLRGSHLLVASGRRPSTDRLNLSVAGVATDQRGYVDVSPDLRTSADGIYALGDVKGGPAFTHISYDDYRVLRDNLLDDAGRTTDGRLVPYTLFTDPQLGRVGLSEAEAVDQNLDVKIASMPMSRVARALEIDEAHGLMKAVVDADTDQILGATVLGPEGGEVMSVLQMAMMGDVPYTRIRESAFAHPTFAESLNNLFGSLRDPDVNA